VPESQNSAPKRFYHGRVIGLVLGMTLFAMVVVDFLFDQRLSWWTLGKTLGSTVVILAYFYIARFPKLRGK
jgi:Mg/Co/Ni transporter MgtE